VVFLTSPLGADVAPTGVKFLGTADTGYGRFTLE
jgi:hypothetical protein